MIRCLIHDLAMLRLERKREEQMVRLRGRGLIGDRANLLAYQTDVLRDQQGVVSSSINKCALLFMTPLIL